MIIVTLHFNNDGKSLTLAEKKSQKEKTFKTFRLVNALRIPI